MKYIVMMVNEKEEIFIFPRSIDHDRFAEGVTAIRFGTQNNWKRSLRGEEVISAGFVSSGVCHGKSETLGIGSRAEEDNLLLSNQYRLSKA